MNRLLTALLGVALGAPLLAVAACEDKKASTDTARADAGPVDKYATADPKLEKALAAASASAVTDNGPPVDGIFAAGLADARHPKGVPAKVDVVSDGADPKISLQSGADASPDAARATSYGPAILEYAMQMGPRMAMPTIDFGMVLGPAKKDEGGSDVLVALVKQAGPAREQMGQLQPGTDKQIATLEGSTIRMSLTPDGRVTDTQVQLSKSGLPDLDRLVINASEALVFATVPAPPKPVGVGAQWIAETRMPLSGLDVIAYRAYRISKIDGDRISLTLEVKAYAASKDVTLQGVPKGANLVQFDAESEGQLELVRGEALARKSDLTQQVVLVFEPPGGAPQPKPGQQQDPQAGMLQAQLQSKATFLRGDDLKNELKAAGGK